MAELKHLWCLKNGLLSFHLAPPLARLLNCGWNKRAQGLPQAKHKARSLYLSHVGRQEVQATWVFFPVILIPFRLSVMCFGTAFINKVELVKILVIEAFSC